MRLDRLFAVSVAVVTTLLPGAAFAQQKDSFGRLEYARTGSAARTAPKPLDAHGERGGKGTPLFEITHRGGTTTSNAFTVEKRTLVRGSLYAHDDRSGTTTRYVGVIAQPGGAPRHAARGGTPSADSSGKPKHAASNTVRGAVRRAAETAAKMSEPPHR